VRKDSVRTLITVKDNSRVIVLQVAILGGLGKVDGSAVEGRFLETCLLALLNSHAIDGPHVISAQALGDVWAFPGGFGNSGAMPEAI
jgi:hypothetical protein